MRVSPVLPVPPIAPILPADRAMNFASYFPHVFITPSRRALIAIALSSLTVSCGGSSNNNGTTGPITGGNSFSAKINGVAWNANPATLAVGAVRAGAGLYTLTGSSATTFQSLSFSLYNIAAAGTYPLGVTPQIFGGSVSVANTTSGWGTPLNGTAGQINITTLTSSRIAGTFNFTANPQTATTTTLTVTDGTFDLPVTVASSAVVPDNAGSKVNGTIGGAVFIASTASNVFSSGSNTLTITAGNQERTLSFSLAGVSTAGTYGMSTSSPVRTMQVSGSPTSATATWSSQAASGSGTVVITSFTATRIVGTFTGTLSALGGGATGSLAVSGSFDLGRL